MVRGIDVSAYQQQVDWRQVKAAGYLFGFCKCTEGVTYVDPTFHTHWQGMLAASVIPGAYLFFRPADGGVAQAQHFCTIFKPEKGCLPPVIDVERQGPSPSLYAQSLRACLKEVEQLSGMKPLIYCSPGWWDSHLTGDFSDWNVWVAHYTQAPHPNLPRGFQRWLFWQFSSSGQVPGIKGSCDLDRFAGELSDLENLCKK